MRKILILLVFGISHVLVQASGFTTRDGITITGDNYITQAMTFIPIDTPINKLAISASHDSASYSIHTVAVATAANTQYFAGTLSAQLHAGIRWFDLRVHLTGGNLIAYHTIATGSFPIDDDIQYINTFLLSNPGEFVVLSLIDGDKSTAVVNALTNLLSQSNPIIVQDPNQPPLTYAQVKGKVVITTIDDNSLNQCVYPGQTYDPVMPENIGHEIPCIASATPTESKAVVMHEIRAEERISGSVTYWGNYIANFGQMNPIPGNLDAQDYGSALAQLGAIANAGIPAALYDIADAYKSDNIEIGAILHDTVLQDYDLYQYFYALMYYKYNPSSSPTFIDTLKNIGFPHKLLITFDSFCSPFIGGYASDQCYSNRNMNSVIFNASGNVINSGIFSLNNVASSKIEFSDNGDSGNYITIVPNSRFGRSFGILVNPAYHGKWASYFKAVDTQSITSSDLSQIWSHLSIRAKSPIINSNIDAMSINNEAYRQTADSSDGLNGGYVSPENSNTVSVLYREN